MGKRYVFWRGPDGTPYRRTDQKYAPIGLLTKIGNSASINELGKITWGDISVLKHHTAIRAAVVVLDPEGTELNETDAWTIVNAAIKAVIGKKGGKCPVTPSEVIAEADKAAATHFRKAVADYVLVTSLSVKSFPTSRVKVHGCEILPHKTRGARFPVPDTLASRRAGTRFRKHIESTAYLPIRVKTTGRTIHEAAEVALEAVNVLRGFWNLIATYGTWSLRFSATERKPLGVVHAGPVHRLYYPDGTPVGDTYWYEPEFVEDRDLFEPKKGWGQIEKNRQSAMRRLPRLEYRRDLESLIARYALALDQLDLDLAFLQMWSILEKLTDTVGGRYDKTISRAVWPFTDRNVAKEVLEVLRFRRNRLVHSFKSDSDPDQFAYFIKSFIELHLVHLIHNDFGVSSLEEYGKHLDLPTNIETLEKKKDRLGKAIRILKKRAKPE